MGATARSRRGLVALTMVGCLGALVLGTELWLRAQISPPPQPEQFRYAQPPLARLQVKVTRAMPGLAPRETEFNTNALGLRGDELDLRDHRALRILTLGDSITEALLLSDHDAWPHLLQERLAAALHRPVWVGNAARSGQLVVDFVAHVKLLAPLLEPDLIVVMPGGFELQAAVEEKLVPADLDDASRLAEHAAKLYVPATLRDLEPSYTAFMLYSRLHPETLDLTGLYERMRARRAAATSKRTEIPDLDDALDLYRAALGSLVRSARALRHPARLVLLTSPAVWRDDLGEQEQRALWAGYTCMDCSDPEYIDHRSLARGLQRFNGALLELCQTESLSCLDLEGMIPKSFANFYDDAHLTEAGARIAAEAISKFIVETGITGHAHAP